MKIWCLLSANILFQYAHYLTEIRNENRNISLRTLNPNKDIQNIMLNEVLRRRHRVYGTSHMYAKLTAMVSICLKYKACM